MGVSKTNVTKRENKLVTALYAAWEDYAPQRRAIYSGDKRDPREKDFKANFAGREGEKDRDGNVSDAIKI